MKIGTTVESRRLIRQFADARSLDSPICSSSNQTVTFSAVIFPFGWSFAPAFNVAVNDTIASKGPVPQPQLNRTAMTNRCLPGSTFRATASGSGLSRLSDANAQLDTIGQLLAMQYSGVNPILVQAYADYFDRSRRGYRDYNFNQIGRGSIQNPIDWLRSSQWADLLG